MPYPPCTEENKMRKSAKFSALLLTFALVAVLAACAPAAPAQPAQAPAATATQAPRERPKRPRRQKRPPQLKRQWRPRLPRPPKRRRQPKRRLRPRRPRRRSSRGCPGGHQLRQRRAADFRAELREVSRRQRRQEGRPLAEDVRRPDAGRQGRPGDRSRRCGEQHAGAVDRGRQDAEACGPSCRRQQIDTIAAWVAAGAENN